MFVQERNGMLQPLEYLRLVLQTSPARWAIAPKGSTETSNLTNTASSNLTAGCKKDFSSGLGNDCLKAKCVSQAQMTPLACCL